MKRTYGEISLLALVTATLVPATQAFAIDTEVTAPGREGPSASTQAADAEYVGRLACVDCHPREIERWRGSYHDLAMQVADSQTVLGNFDDTTFEAAGVTSRFFRRDDKFMVRTENSQGDLEDYEVAYTFGASPLQQYLVGFAGGRYQPLAVAWDSRPAAIGGGRWFHLYPNERIKHDDRLHWTGRYQNWNFMCAECHSTGLRKGYVPSEDRYQTTWEELDVSCEACHGPASRHVAWAKQAAASRPAQADADKGLLVSLSRSPSVIWAIDSNTGNAERAPSANSRALVDACARCHSRRVVAREPYEFGKPLLDTHTPALLDEGLYFADGQIEDEVYVYGSFVQSRMYNAGVSCSNCHDPHSLALHAEGNGLCASCHLSTKFDTREHHHHEPGSEGAACVACHMPARNYMVVDPRRDHAFRVPRPDLSLDIGTPNACNGCHVDRPVSWAAESVVSWYGTERSASSHYGRVINAGREGGPGAEAALVDLIARGSEPAIVRATALNLLGSLGRSRRSVATVAGAARDSDPLVRYGAARALTLMDPRYSRTLALALLTDPILSVRIEAARASAPIPAAALTSAQYTARESAIGEFRAAKLASGELPGSQVALGALYQEMGRYADAEKAYRAALALDRAYGPAHVNLADLSRVRGRDEDAENMLRQALALTSDDADLHHALGLLLARTERIDQALAELGRAVSLAPDDARNAYVLGIALNSAGKTDSALEVLQRSHEQHPYDRPILLGLATMSRDSGATDSARDYTSKLLMLDPADVAARSLAVQLEHSKPAP